MNYIPAVYSNDIGNQVLITPESFNYVFNYTDHLGNIRLSYGVDPSTQLVKIIEENHYYPFGLKHTRYNMDWNLYERKGDGNVELRPGRPAAPLEFKYKYNGKELQDELGLNFYDYGARNYDPALGRWMNIDPLAEQYRRWSPYNYCVDNPIRFVDPDGMGVYDWRNKKGDLVYDTTLNGGKGGYTANATADDKNLGKALQQTPTGKEQFNKLVTSDVKTYVSIDKVNTPVDKDGKMVAGDTTPILSKSGKVAQVEDETGKVVGLKPEGFEMTIYQKNVESLVDGNSKGGAGVYGKELPKGTTFSQAMGVIFGHEIEHATIQDLLYGMKNPTKNEVPATNISNKIIDELKK